MTTTSANQKLIIGEANSITEMLGERLAIVFGGVKTIKVVIKIEGHTKFLDEYKLEQAPEIKKQKPYWRKNERW